MSLRRHRFSSARCVVLATVNCSAFPLQSLHFPPSCHHAPRCTTTAAAVSPLACALPQSTLVHNTLLLMPLLYCPPAGVWEPGAVARGAVTVPVPRLDSRHGPGVLP